VGTGLIFPGQGSQQVGMGASFVEHHALARQLFEEAGDALGFDLKKLCLEGPEEELTLTYNSQAAILTVSTIAHRLLAERVELAPAALAGHSVGEYSAVVAAGALEFRDAVLTVYKRGQFMQGATPVGVGAMAAILGLEADEVERLCAEAAQGQVVQPANFNTPGQIVISGHAEAVGRVLEKAKGKLLAVSAPFHSPLMQPAADNMREVLQALRFSNARWPVVANVDNRFISDAAEFPQSLENQIVAPVRWAEGVSAMLAAGVDTFLEFGHGKVLAGMMKRIDKTARTLNVYDEESLTQTIQALQG